MAMNDRGRFYWYDLMTTDLEKAKSFYTKLIGWGTTVWEGAGQPYTMWTNGEATVGGIRPLSEQARAQGAPGAPVPEVPDAEGGIAEHVRPDLVAEASSLYGSSSEAPRAPRAPSA